MADCAICVDDIVDRTELSCRHAFCRECIERWTNAQQGTPRCPMCREVYSLDPPEVWVSSDEEDSPDEGDFGASVDLSFMTGDVDWLDFVDFPDPGPTFDEFDRSGPRRGLGQLQSRRDLFRHVVGEVRSRSPGGRRLNIYRYNNLAPAPIGLFDHWRARYMHLEGDEPLRIGFYLANSGLARVDITSGPGDQPPRSLFICRECSRFVTSDLDVLDNHVCSTQIVRITTHSER